MYIRIKNTVLKKNILYYILAILLITAACNKDSSLEYDMGYNYYPINTGHWIIYQVDSISWNEFFDSSSDTFQYQIMEIIESEFIDNEGRTTARIERYKRNSDTNQWIIKDVWFANLTSSTAEKVEENIRYIKLKFPCKIDYEWNGNAYNELGEQTYTYEYTNDEYSINDLDFDSTVKVIQKNEMTLISRKYSSEVYAKNVGMIYKSFTNLKTEATGEIVDGITYTYKVKSWGDQ